MITRSTIDLFTHDKYFEKIQQRADFPKSVEQCCVHCRKWFSVDSECVRAALAVWRSDVLWFPTSWCRCSHCKETQILVMPGKYDNSAIRYRCHVQCWKW